MRNLERGTMFPESPAHRGGKQNGGCQGGVGGGELGFAGGGVSVRDDEKALEMGGGDGCSTV